MKTTVKEVLKDIQNKNILAFRYGNTLVELERLKVNYVKDGVMNIITERTDDTIYLNEAYHCANMVEHFFIDACISEDTYDYTVQHIDILHILYFLYAHLILVKDKLKKPDVVAETSLNDTYIRLLLATDYDLETLIKLTDRLEAVNFDNHKVDKFEDEICEVTKYITSKVVPYLKARNKERGER